MYPISIANEAIDLRLKSRTGYFLLSIMHISFGQKMDQMDPIFHVYGVLFNSGQLDPHWFLSNVKTFESG